MAAGFGSRFGGNKQLYSFTKNNYSILDLSIYDALRAGFNDIVFIVREDIIDQFKTKYSPLASKSITLSYIIQDTTNIPKLYGKLKRLKPWGTGHALLTLKGIVTNKFALINTDDFYGKEAFIKIHDSLFKSTSNFLIGYKLNNTLSKNGSVSRGECFLDSKNNLQQIIERTGIAIRKKELSYIENVVENSINKNAIVSMNFWGFNPEIIDIAAIEFNKFLENYKSDNAEYYITMVVEAAIKKEHQFKVITTNSKWFGITYKEDIKLASEEIKGLINAKIYPSILW